MGTAHIPRFQNKIGTATSSDLEPETDFSGSFPARSAWAGDLVAGFLVGLLRDDWQYPWDPLPVPSREPRRIPVHCSKTIPPAPSATSRAQGSLAVSG